MPSTLISTDLSPYVDSFENLRRFGPTDILPHLPPRNHAGYLKILAELIRVDLEYGWNEENFPRMADYLKRFPELASDSTSLTEVAFEEYRLRLEHGDTPTPGEYARQYQIDTAGWKSDTPNSDDLLRTIEATADEVVEAALQLQRWLSSSGHKADSIPEASQTRVSPTFEKLRELHQSNPAVAEKLTAAVTTFPTIGSTFLGFKLISELGRGAFARVYLAEQENLAGRMVALKVTPNFTSEAKALAQLQHTNIVPIHSVHYSGSHQAICMPYFGATTLADVLSALSHVRGERSHSGLAIVSTMRQRLAQRHTEKASTATDREMLPSQPAQLEKAAANLLRLSDMSLTDAILWIVARVAEGLAHAHERGIVHRDIKPANILMSDDGQPMLLDFNLSADSKTEGNFGGTLAYMAPEHLEAFAGRGPRPDHRSDIYSLGIILYELLAGRPAFAWRSTNGSTFYDDLIQQRRQGPSPVRKFNRDVSPAVESIVMKCLESEPKRRYQNAADLLEDLERHREDLPLRHANNSSIVERMHKWSRRHPSLTSTTAVAIAALGILAAGMVGTLGLRESHRTLAARQNYRDWLQDMAEARAALYRRDPTRAELEHGLTRGRDGLQRFSVLSKPDWDRQPAVTYLPSSERDRLRDDAGEMLFLLAKGAADQARRAVPAERSSRLSEALEWNRRAEGIGGRVTRAIGLQKAELMRLQGDPTADEVRQNAEKVPPASARDLYLLGHADASRGEYDRALAALIEATRRDPESFPAWFVRGQCHFARMQFDQASECFSVCIALRPEDAHAWQNRGVTAFQRNRPREALKDLDRAIELKPADPDLHIDRAAIRTSTGAHALAAEDLTTAIALGSARTRVYFMRATVRERAGDQAGGAEDRKQGRALTPTDEGSWLALAEDAVGTDKSAALVAVEEALKLNPNSSTALQFQAHLLTELGRMEDAERTLNLAIKLYPDHAPFWCGRGVHHARLGKREQAIADAREALARDTTPPNLYQAGCVYALTSAKNADDRDEALRLIRAAIVAGFGREYLSIDTDLDPIRKTPEFAAIVKLAAQKTKSPRQ